MKHIKLLFAFLFFTIYGCKTDIQPEDLKHLNGYWEITKVEMPDGDEKEFKVNESMDFIHFEDKNGFRVKVIPQIDGGFLSNKTKENFDILEKESVFYFLYKTDFASWEEEIITINNEELVVKNSNDLVYFYKKRTDLNKK
uniref:lipocalin family protein n=1 Tax=Flavobacterium sp. TaxID=239 RepID=UPI00404ABF9A